WSAYLASLHGGEHVQDIAGLDIAVPLRARHHSPINGHGDAFITADVLMDELLDALRLGFYFFAVETKSNHDILLNVEGGCGMAERIARRDRLRRLLAGSKLHGGACAECGKQNAMAEVSRGHDEVVTYLAEIWQVIRGSGASAAGGFEKLGFF